MVALDHRRHRLRIDLRHPRQHAALVRNQQVAAAPRVGRDLLVAHERGVLARMSQVYSKAMSSVVEGDHVAIHWIFELTDISGKVYRIDEMSLQEWRGDKIFRERFFYDPSRPKT